VLLYPFLYILSILLDISFVKDINILFIYFYIYVWLVNEIVELFLKALVLILKELVQEETSQHFESSKVLVCSVLKATENRIYIR